MKLEDVFKDGKSRRISFQEANLTTLVDLKIYKKFSRMIEVLEILCDYNQIKVPLNVDKALRLSGGLLSKEDIASFLHHYPQPETISRVKIQKHIYLENKGLFTCLQFIRLNISHHRLEAGYLIPAFPLQLYYIFGLAASPERKIRYLENGELMPKITEELKASKDAYPVFCEAVICRAREAVENFKMGKFE